MNKTLYTLAREIAKNTNYTSSDTEVMLYGLNVLINNLVGLLLILFFAYWTNLFYIAIAVLITTTPLRIFSGGAHASKVLHCWLIGTSLVLLICLAAEYFAPFFNYHNLLLITTFISLCGFIILSRYSPADVPNKPIKAQNKPRLKKLSYLVLATWTIILILMCCYQLFPRYLILASALGLALQLYNVTPIAFKTVVVFENLFFGKVVKK